MENKRLEVLKSYEILDTESEKDFDEITQLASKICNKPISVISLIDKDRQWFKSKYGLEADETPRDVAFCDHVIRDFKLMEVKNATKDHRFKDNPLVKGNPNIRFYAGYPLTTKDGYNLGTLCVIDDKEGKLTELQKESLRVLANQVMKQMELRIKNKKLKESYKALKRNQEQMIQNSKFVTMGTLLGGIAHEINNPLMILNGNAQQLKMIINKNMDKEVLFKKIDNISHATFRVKDIIGNLVGLIKDENIEKEDVDLDNLVQSVINIFDHSFKSKNINLEYSINENIKWNCNSVKVKEMLLNLIKNSYDAIKESKNPWIKIEIKTSKKMINIDITDSGMGLDKKVSSEVFDPFFTTKEIGSGYGLGLSISKKIAESHNGNILYKEKKGNTNFNLNFNLTKEKKC